MHRDVISFGRVLSAHRGPQQRLRILAAALSVVAAGGTIARAANVSETWLSAVNGTWTDTTKWSAAVVPNNGADTYTVTIGATGAAYTVTLNSTITVNSLTLNSADATLSHTAGTFTATGGLNLLAGNYTLAGGAIANTTVNGPGSLSFTSSNGAPSNVTVNGDLNFGNSFARALLSNGTTFNTAHLTGQGSEIGFQAGSSLTGNVFFEGTAPSGRLLTLASAGAFTIPGTSVVKTVAGFTSDGQVGGNGFAFSGAMNLTNNGQISSEVSGRTISINAATFSNVGTVSALNGGIVNVNGTYTNSGTFVLNGSTMNLGGTFNATGGVGNFSNTAGTVNLSGTVNNTGNNLTLNANTGSWNLVGGTISGGSLNFANGQTLNLSSASGTIVGVTVNGDLNFPTAFARVIIGSGTSFNTAHLIGQGSEIGFLAGATLTGVVQAEGSAPSGRLITMATSGSFTIGAGGAFKTVAGFTSDGQIGGNGFAFSGAMNLTNNGLISSEVNGRAIIINAATFTNSATVQAVNGGILNFNSAAYTNPGTIIVNASTVNLAGTFNTAAGIGNFLNTAGTVNVTGTINNTGNNLTLNSITGSWNLIGGTINGGSLTFANGQALVPTSSNGSLAGVTINGDLSFTGAFARALLSNGTTFSVAHLAGQGAEIGYVPGSTLSGSVWFEGAAPSGRFLTLSAPGSFTIAATGVVKTTTGLASDGQIGGNGFAYSAAMNLTNNGLISSEVSGRTLSVNATTFTNNGTMRAINGGRLIVANCTGSLGSLTVDALGGLARINGTYTINQPVAVTNRATLNLQGNWTRAADVNASGRIIFDYPTAGPTVYSAIRSAIISGYNSGAWNGSGIFSTAAASTPNTGVGYAEASNVLTATGGNFSGETVDGTAVLVRWTYKGDANLDGQVDVSDLGRLATNWQTSADWSGGDFNYDHFVDVTDLGALATSWQQGVGNPLGKGSFEQALAAVGLGNVAVPEPISVSGTLALTSMLMLGGRRRRIH